MEQKLFLIDGHALIFKMYYAFLRHPMINSKGADMSILFGFTKYLLELVEREKPDFLAVAFDPPGGTFRNELYPEYKATRSATPQLVIDALGPLQELCSAMGIPNLMVKGFEADDVIGTVAKRCQGEGLQVYMVTPDKDYGQLIDAHILQYKPGKGGGDDEVIDREKICQRYGIREPLQVIEMLTLCGDSSDNVPGVKGVGEVGAGKLIARYGTVENIYAHLDELPPRQKAQFEEARGHIELSHKLVTIRTDVPVDTPTSEMALNIRYTPELADLFEKYEFNSLRKHLGAPAGHPARKADIPAFSFQSVPVQEVEQAARKAGLCALVPAGDGQIAVAALHGGDAPIAAQAAPETFRGLLTDEAVAKGGFDLKSLLNALAGDKITMEGKLEDYGLMHYILGPERSHNPAILVKSYLGVDWEEEAPQAEAASLFDAPANSPAHDYCREAAAVLLTGRKIAAELAAQESGRLYEEIEAPLIRVLSKMERTGVKVDIAQLEHFATSLRTEMNRREAVIREMAGVPDLNISSPRQIGQVLFEKLNLDPKAKKSAKGSWSTDEATLSALADRHPIIGEILEFRAVKKLLSTYIEPFPSYVSPQTGRIHTTFNQALTATGRLSSSNPNLQNIPIRTERGKEIRKAFVPATPDGVILSADYSQIELRIMAHLSCDAHLIQAFKDGIDVHAVTAAKIFGIPYEEVTQDQRRIAKTANFGIMYGISAFGLSQRLGISRSEAAKIIEDYFAAFPSIKTFIEDTLVGARENGYVETIFGRRRYIPDINSRNATVRALAERNAVNAPIQGTSADIIKIAMNRIDAAMTAQQMASRMVLQIHDELLFDAVPEEVPALKALVRDRMEHVITLSVPLTVECNEGKNWLEAH